MTKRPITVYRSGSLSIVIAACVLGPTSSLPSFNSPGFSCLSPVNNKPGLEAELVCEETHEDSIINSPNTRKKGIGDAN